MEVADDTFWRNCEWVNRKGSCTLDLARPTLVLLALP